MQRIITIVGLKFIFLIATALHPSPLVIGEKLEYNINLGAVYAGSASLEIAERSVHNGTPCLVFKSKARSATWIDVFFPVRDDITSCWDDRARRTMMNQKRLREGNYIRDYTVSFDHNQQLATWSERSYSGNVKRNRNTHVRSTPEWRERQGNTWELPTQFQDMLSAVYFTRTHANQPRAGLSFILDVYDELKMTQLKMLIVQQEELTLTVKGEEQTFNSWKVQPFLNTTGFFQRANANVHVWISADANRWPLKVTAQVPLAGSIEVVLSDYSIPGQ